MSDNRNDCNQWFLCFPLMTTKEGIIWQMQTFGNWSFSYLLKAVLILRGAVLNIGHAYWKQVLFFAHFLITDLFSVTMEPCKMKTRFQYEQASVNTVLKNKNSWYYLVFICLQCIISKILLGWGGGGIRNIDEKQ